MSMDIPLEIEEEYLHFLLKSDRDHTPTYRSKVHPYQWQKNLPALTPCDLCMYLRVLCEKYKKRVYLSNLL